MVILSKIIDKYLIGAKCAFLALFKRKKPIPQHPQRILLIQLWGIGESILTLPAIEDLRKAFPRATIDLLCTTRNKDVYMNNPDLSSVRVINANPFSVMSYILKMLFKPSSRYDLAIDFEEYLNISAVIAFFGGRAIIGYSHGIRAKLYDTTVNYNDQQHVVYTFEDLLGPLDIWKTPEELPYLPKDMDAEKSVNRWLKKQKIDKKKFVVLAPSVAESGKSRMWPLEKMKEIANYISTAKKTPVVVVGAKKDRYVCDEVLAGNSGNDINSAGIFTLPELFELIKMTVLTISNDTGPMHISAAQKTPTLALFGPNLPIRFSPFGKDHITLYKPDACELSPCINVHKGEVPDCLYSHDDEKYQQCMKAIEVDEVKEAVNKMLSTAKNTCSP